jgi:type I restriction enzyme S subunit
VNQASLNQKDILSLEVGVSPLDPQDRFCQLANTLLPQVEAQQTATEKIKRLFDNLLHRAFAGDLTAKWREAHMKELLQEIEQQAQVLGELGGKSI